MYAKSAHMSQKREQKIDLIKRLERDKERTLQKEHEKLMQLQHEKAKNITIVEVERQRQVRQKELEGLRRQKEA